MNLNFVKHHFNKEFNYQICVEDNETPIFIHNLRSAIPENLLNCQVLYFWIDDGTVDFHISMNTERNAQVLPDEIFKIFHGFTEDITYARTTLDKVEYATDVIIFDNQICVYSEPIE